MLPAPDRASHADRLQDLLQRFRAQELSMALVLLELQAELEHWHREANFLRATSPVDGEAMLRRCSELQSECDLLATELVHVRMAIAGTSEELADYERPILVARSGGGLHMATA